MNLQNYGVTAAGTGYYDDGWNLFYYNAVDGSIMLVATPGGGDRLVFKPGHNLHGAIYTQAVVGSVPYASEEAGLAQVQGNHPEVQRTMGAPASASPFAWLESLEYNFADRKPLVRRPAFWATAGIGLFGVGYFIYSRRAKKA